MVPSETPTEPVDAAGTEGGALLALLGLAALWMVLGLVVAAACGWL